MYLYIYRLLLSQCAATGTSSVIKFLNVDLGYGDKSFYIDDGEFFFTNRNALPPLMFIFPSFIFFFFTFSYSIFISSLPLLLQSCRCASAVTRWALRMRLTAFLVLRGHSQKADGLAAASVPLVPSAPPAQPVVLLFVLLASTSSSLTPPVCLAPLATPPLLAPSPARLSRITTTWT